MSRIFAFLLTGCWHSWEIIATCPHRTFREHKLIELCTRYTLQCKHCGTIKKKDVR